MDDFFFVVLSDEMGLGKTLQVESLLLFSSSSITLIIIIVDLDNSISTLRL